MTTEVVPVRLESGRMAVGLAALLLGVMFAVQFRLQRIVPPPTDTSQLLALLKTSDQKRAQLTQQVNRLSTELNQKLSQQAAARALEAQLTQAEIMAGTIAVTGPGVSVYWANGSAPSSYQITDIDLLLLVNELRAAGAEAISINGQRITGQTEIRAAANYILINDSQQSAPFVINAIGPAATLSDALMLPGGLYDESQQEGRTMTITKERQLQIPPASPPPISYAVPAKGS